MIDRASRDKYAQQLRHFAAGVLTVAEYEDRADDLAWDSDDAALFPIWETAWVCYDDFRTECLRGGWALNKEARRDFARAILFLQSDTPFEWPDFRYSGKDRLTGAAVGFVDFLLVPLDFFSFGVLQLQEKWWRFLTPFRNLRWEKQQAFMRSVGEPDVWPFLRRADFDAALQKPKFLRGT